MYAPLESMGDDPFAVLDGEEEVVLEEDAPSLDEEVADYRWTERKNGVKESAQKWGGYIGRASGGGMLASMAGMVIGGGVALQDPELGEAIYRGSYRGAITSLAGLLIWRSADEFLETEMPDRGSLRSFSYTEGVGGNVPEMLSRSENVIVDFPDKGFLDRKKGKSFVIDGESAGDLYGEVIEDLSEEYRENEILQAVRYDNKRITGRSSDRNNIEGSMNSNLQISLYAGGDHEASFYADTDVEPEGFERFTEDKVDQFLEYENEGGFAVEKEW